MNFSNRNHIYYKVGELVFPVILCLHSPPTFDGDCMLELGLALRKIIVDDAKKDNNAYDIYDGRKIKFKYRFRKTFPRYSLLLKRKAPSEKTKTENDNENEIGNDDNENDEEDKNSDNSEDATTTTGHKSSTITISTTTTMASVTTPIVISDDEKNDDSSANEGKKDSPMNTDDKGDKEIKSKTKTKSKTKILSDDEHEQQKSTSPRSDADSPHNEDNEEDGEKKAGKKKYDYNSDDFISSNEEEEGDDGESDTEKRRVDIRLFQEDIGNDENDQTDNGDNKNNTTTKGYTHFKGGYKGFSISQPTIIVTTMEPDAPSTHSAPHTNKTISKYFLPTSSGGGSGANKVHGSTVYNIKTPKKNKDKNTNKNKGSSSGSSKKRKP